MNPLNGRAQRPPEDSEIFDYVVVGAGSAGCVLVHRLAANGHRVLLLEAGGHDQRFYVQIPIGYGKTFSDPKVNWRYRTAPDAGLAGRSDYWPRGKVLGGSSSINAMVYIRGHPSDYDDWRRAGNPGWGWDDVVPYFEWVERNGMSVTDISSASHRSCEYFIRAGDEIGLPHRRNFNDGDQLGVGHYHLTTAGGQRMSAARAFLTPARRYRNLTVITDALTERVLFSDRTATGVVYRHGRRRRRAVARHEVVLCAGAIGSAQILQLSGIGNGSQLTRLGIESIVDNDNVGKHLQDHLGINYYYASRIPTLNQSLSPWQGKLRAGLQYVLNRSGPLSLGVNQAGGFVALQRDRQRPDLQLYFQPFSTLEYESGTRPLLNPDPFPAFAIGMSTCRPKSRGYLSIDSPDADRQPVIQPNSLSAPEDVDAVVTSLRWIRRLAATRAMSALIERELTPGSGCEDDDAMLEDFRQRAGTVYHPSCTCRMGPSANGAVVDAELKVHGVSALRVADASIFPNIICGNTNAAAMMVGAKAADLINGAKED